MRRVWAAAFVALLAFPPQVRAQQSIAGGYPAINSLSGFPLTVVHGGTGATNTVTSRANLGAWPQVDAVTDLGFVGNGITDNSGKLAALFAYTTNPTVYFDPGTYMVGCPSIQTAASNINLIGAGVAQTILKFSAGCAIPNVGVFQWTGKSGVEIANLTLDANAATRSGQISCIFCFNWPTDIKIHDIAIINWTTNFNAIAIVSGGGLPANRFSIRDNYFLLLNTVTAATVVAGGAGGTNGACTVTGTTGTGTKFQASGTVTGNVLGGALTIQVAGLYSANPTNSAVEPVTGCGLTGATLKLTLSNSTQNQAVILSDAGNAGISDGFIHHNVLINTAFEANAHDIYFSNNDISGHGFGEGIVLDFATNSHDVIIANNDCHDSAMGFDSNLVAVGCIEAYGTPDVMVIGNVCRNLFGACVDNGSPRGVIVGNRAYGIGKRHAVDGGNTCAFVGLYVNASQNSNGSTYTGNFAQDDGSGNQLYGYCDQSSSVANVSLFSNNFANNATGPIQKLSSTTYFDPSSNAQVMTYGNVPFFGGTSANPSLSAASGFFGLHGSSTNLIEFGTYATSPFGVWLQTTSDLFGGSTTYPIDLNPLGGGVAIGSTGTPPANGLLTGGAISNGAYEQITGTTLPTQAAGTLGLGGIASAPTLAANGEGDIYLATVNGLTLQGQGSTYDISLLNKSGTVALGVSTGTTTLTVPGALNVAGITSITNATASSAFNNGALVVTGGVGVGGQITGNSNLSINGTGFNINNNGATSIGWGISGTGTLNFILNGSGSKLDYGVTTAGTWTNSAPETWTSATLKMTAITTGTNADFLCRASDGTVLLQTSACTISSMRFKNLIGSYADDSLSTVAGLSPIVFTRKRDDEHPDPDNNAYEPQIGLSAENVAASEPRCAIYEQDGITPKSYRQECIIAVLVAAMQAQQREISALRR